MNWEQRRLLEMAGLLRRGTPDRLLREGEEDDSGGDDPFADDDGGDEGGDDPFADDSEGDDGDDGDSDKEEDDDLITRKPPEELKPSDIEQFGSPRFLEIETKLKSFFNDCLVSAGAAAQNLETYPGNAIDEEPTPAKDEDKEEKNESFYRYGSRRDKWLINEANRLLLEAEEEGSAADIFDMERFCTEIANYLDNIHNTEDVEAGIFNSARQMILNNFGQTTEQEFVDMLSAVTDGKWSFLKTGFEGAPAAPPAVGATDSAGA